MDWLLFAGFLFGVAILIYALRSKAISQQPSQRGLFIGTGLALIAIASWMSLQQFAPEVRSKDIPSFLFVFLSIILCGSMVSYPFIRKVAGTLLVEVRRPFSRKVSGFATAGLFVLLIVFTLVHAEYSRENIIELIFYTSVVLYFASPLFGKIKFREHGIVDTYSFFQWKNISSYRWVGQNESTLMIHVKTLWRRTAAFVLPPDQKEFIDAILKQHINRS